MWIQQNVKLFNPILKTMSCLYLRSLNADRRDQVQRQLIQFDGMPGQAEEEGREA
jgi:hypothetical protein